MLEAALVVVPVVVDELVEPVDDLGLDREREERLVLTSASDLVVNDLWKRIMLVRISPNLYYVLILLHGCEQRRGRSLR